MYLECINYAECCGVCFVDIHFLLNFKYLPGFVALLMFANGCHKLEGKNL